MKRTEYQGPSNKQHKTRISNRFSLSFSTVYYTWRDWLWVWAWLDEYDPIVVWPLAIVINQGWLARAKAVWDGDAGRWVKEVEF